MDEEQLRAQLRDLFPDGYILLHKNGREVSLRFSELQWWIDYLHRVALEEKKVLDDE